MDNRVLITIARHTLTDGSLVYNVDVDATLHAVSEQDAQLLADKLRDAIDAHTLETPIIAYS